MALPGFFRRMLNHMGFKKEEEERRSETGKTKGGFRTKMAVPVSGIADGPVVSQCNYGNGGVQGLRWYSEMLRADDDGDVAQEFLRESVSVGRNNKKRTRFQVQMRTRFVKLKGPLCQIDGNVHQFVESGGEVYWA